MKENFKQNRLLNKETILEKQITEKYSYGKVERGKKIPITSDAMFKCMLGNEKRKIFLLRLLKATFDIYEMGDLLDLEYIKNTVEQENYYDKGRVVDLIAKSNLGILNVEVNNNSSTNRYMLRRNIGYAFAISNSQIKRGNNYIKYVPTIQININNFAIKGEKRSTVLYYISDEKGNPLTDDLIIIQIYLPNIRRKWYNKEELTEMDKILLVYNEDTNNLDPKLYEGDKNMEKYLKEAEDVSKDEEIIGLYDLEELRKDQMLAAKETGYNEGMEQGKNEEKLSIASKLLKEGLSIEQIIKVTNLSPKEIESLN